MASFSIGFDGVRYLLTTVEDDGTVLTARLPAGTHTNQDSDAVVASLRQAYSTLRQWALDAQDAYDTWPTKTAAQKDATQREVIRRLGIFFDRFGDLLVALNVDS